MRQRHHNHETSKQISTKCILENSQIHCFYMFLRQRLAAVHDAVQASLAEQVSGPSAGAALRDGARRKRFAVLWQRILDDVAMTDVERCRKWLVNAGEASTEWGEQRVENEGWHGTIYGTTKEQDL